jgi:beta-lactamase class A
MDNKLKNIINKAGGSWGIYAKELDSNKTIFELNADMPFPAASVNKLAIALYAFSEVSALDDTVSLDEKYMLGGSGVLRHLHAGLQPTLTDLIKLLLIVSDNTAAKLLVTRFTPQKINEYLLSAGFSVTQLKIDGEKFGYGMTTPKEISHLLEGIYANTFMPEARSQQLLAIMKESASDDRIRRYLPHDLYNTDVKLEVANKAGSIPGARSDVGIIFEKQPYTLCVLSKDLPDESYKVDNQGVLAIAEISKVIYAARQLA